MQSLLQQLMPRLIRLSHWVDGIVAQALIVVLAVALAAAAGASA